MSSSILEIGIITVMLPLSVVVVDDVDIDVDVDVDVDVDGLRTKLTLVPVGEVIQITSFSGIPKSRFIVICTALKQYSKIPLYT